MHPHIFNIKGIKKTWFSWMPSWFVRLFSAPSLQDFVIEPTLPLDIYPDVIIVSGDEMTAHITHFIKQTYNSCQLIAMGKPAGNLEIFDKIVLHPFEEKTNDNEFLLPTTLHSLHPDALRAAKAAHYRSLDRYPEPRVGILIGGHQKGFSYDEDCAHLLAKSLRELHQKQGCSFFIHTNLEPSHPFIHHLKRYLFEIPYHLNESSYENPYLGYLALSQAFIVFSDSHELLHEALYTQKPVYIYENGPIPSGYKKYLEELYEKKIAQSFDGAIDFNQNRPAINIDYREQLDAFLGS